VLVWAVFVVILVLAGRRDEARSLARFIPDCLVLFGRLIADPRVPRRRKLLFLGLVGYLAMPFDLVPDFIPIAGQLDDVIVVAIVLRSFLRSGGEPLVRELWPGPDDSLRLGSPRRRTLRPCWSGVRAPFAVVLAEHPRLAPLGRSGKENLGCVHVPLGDGTLRVPGPRLNVDLRVERVAPLPSDEEGKASEFSFCLSEPSLGTVSEPIGREPLLFQVAQLRAWCVRSLEYGSRSWA